MTGEAAQTGSAHSNDDTQVAQAVGVQKDQDGGALT